MSEGESITPRVWQFDRYEGSMPMSVFSIVRPVTFCAILGRDERLSNLEAWLGMYGYVCLRVDSYHGMIHHLRTSAVEIILLIEPNPKVRICELVQGIRRHPATEETPLVVIGPQNDNEMVDALVVGADIYLDYTTVYEVIVARIRALMRRISSSRRFVGVSSFGAYSFSEGSDRVSMDGLPVCLTRMEYRAALLLFSRHSRVVTFSDLWVTMWEGVSRQDPQRHNVCVHISRLRCKLKLDGEYGYRLISVRGTGYTLAVTARRINEAVRS